jgi:hypothetical protein
LLLVLEGAGAQVVVVDRHCSREERGSRGKGKVVSQSCVGLKRGW